MKKIIKSKDNLKFSVKVTAHVKTRTYFSIQHIQSAALFTRAAHKLEKEYDGVFNNDLFIEHRAFVTGAIISAVSCLEAFINELFTDMADGENGENIRRSTKYANLPNDVIMAWAESWRRGIPKTAKYPIIKKYEIAMQLANIEPFKKETFCTDLWLLTKLRNSLIHYEPEWIDSHSNETYEVHEFERLLSGKFAINPLAGVGNGFYPDKCLSHGCADWAVNAVIIFIENFAAKVNILPSFHHVKDKLSTVIEA